MEQRRKSGLGPVKLAPEHVSKQRVIAVPASTCIQGDDEQVGSLHLFKDQLRSACAGHSVTKPSRHPIQDRSSHQEGPDVGRLPVKHLGNEIVDDLPVVAGERTDLPVDVLVPAERKPGKVHPRSPAFGPLLQNTNVFGLKVNVECLLEQSRRLGLSKAKLFGAKLGHLPPCSQPGER